MISRFLIVNGAKQVDLITAMLQKSRKRLSQILLLLAIRAGDLPDFGVDHPVLASGRLHKAEMVYLHRDVRLR